METNRKERLDKAFNYTTEALNDAIYHVKAIGNILLLENESEVAERAIRLVKDLESCIEYADSIKKEAIK